MSHRALRRLALLSWALCVAFEALSVLLLALIRSHPGVYVFDYWAANAVGVVVFSTLGAVIATRRPENPVGWLFCAAPLAGAASHLGIEYAVYALLAEPRSLPGGEAAAWIACWAFVPFFGLLAFAFLLFPDGRLPSPRWRPLAWAGGLAVAVGTALAAFSPGAPGWLGPIENPLGVRALGDVSEAVEFVLIALIVSSAAASLATRLRRARGDERQQMKWFAYAAVPCATGFVLSAQVLSGTAGAGWASWAASSLLVAGVASFATALGVAILKYRLYDIDLVVNRALVYGALTACVVALYVLVVGYLGALFRAPQDGFAISLLAAGAVAVLFAPLRDRLQRGVNRLMYGERDDPYKVLSDLGERMGSTPDPDAVLPDVARAVAQALKLPHVAVRLKRDGGEPVDAARYGEAPPAEPLALPLAYQNEEVGELLVSPRAGSDGFGKQELVLLEALARQIGVAAHAARLTEDLRHSRERLVVAREEERRRLRNDLHDGVGPRLAALTLKLEAARNGLPQDPEEAAALMEALAEHARETVADVRRSVRALRPPALDDFGLVGALREGAAQYGHDGGPRVTVEAPEEMPPLPAAAEVACYRIAQEAMTNAVRHSGASSCAVRVRLDEGAGVLIVEAEDDGRGIRRGDRAGVGLRSMRERAEELGGTCVVEALPRGGTRVAAELPCRMPRGTDAAGEDRREGA